MDRKTKGRLAEAKVLAYLIELDYEVYMPFSNNSKYDAIAVKDGVVKRISIKFTSVKRPLGTWVVEMRQIYRGNNKINIDKFDKSQCDLIGVYIGPLDKVKLVSSSMAMNLALYLKN